MTLTTQCTRCLGTGKHSYNLMHGDVCFKCGGLGVTPIAPKGQKRTKAVELHKAVVGDTIKVSHVLCAVTSIKWIEHHSFDIMTPRYNQVVRYTRAVDGKKFKTWRTVYSETGNFINPVEQGTVGTEA